MKAPPFHIAPGTELRLHGTLQVVRTVDENGRVVLECPLRKTAFETSLSELVLMRMKGDAKPAVEVAPTHVPSGSPRFERITDEQRRVIARRIAYGRAAAREYPFGPKSPRLQRVLEEVAEVLKDPNPPSCHSVYRWARRYVQSDYDTSVFMQDACVMRTRTPRVAPAVKTRLLEHIQTLMARYPSSTLHGLTDIALALTARDLGHVTFISKRGTEELVDAFIHSAEAQLPVQGKADRSGERGVLVSKKGTIQ